MHICQNCYSIETNEIFKEIIVRDASSYYSSSKWYCEFCFPAIRVHNIRERNGILPEKDLREKLSDLIKENESLKEKVKLEQEMAINSLERAEEWHKAIIRERDSKIKMLKQKIEILMKQLQNQEIAKEINTCKQE